MHPDKYTTDALTVTGLTLLFPMGRMSEHTISKDLSDQTVTTKFLT